MPLFFFLQRNKGFSLIVFLFFLILLGLFLFLRNPAPSSSNWQLITGRDNGNPASRTPLYQVKVPSHWIRQDPLITESIQDTKKATCEFYIKQGEEQIRITIHQFPIINEKTRIPAQAQIQRWKQQFTFLDPTLTNLTPSSHGGFVGLCLEAEGVMENKPVKVLAWSMHLAPRYVRQLEFLSPDMQQKRADYTIKAVGLPALINQYRQEIIQFADSFELKDELPCPS